MNFETMTRDQCAAWYLANVGYDPTKEDASITTEQLREDCAEMHYYATCTVDGKGRSLDHPDFDPTVR